MNRGLAEGRRRRRGDRGRIIKSALRGLLLLAVLGIIGAYGYQVGLGLLAEERDTLGREVARLTGDMAAGASARAAQDERLHQLELEVEAEKARYRRDVPGAAELEILRQARRRLEAGIPAARLASVIAAIPAEERCEPALETRRVAIATADFPNVGGVGRFASGGIVVTGAGRSARDEGGRLLAWFDQAAPVTLKFARPGGQASEVTGPLPLFHTMVIADFAWRFTAVPGARSFIELTADRCAFP